MALVTLQRGGEVCGIHAHEIDREGALWTIPGERTKNHRTHVVPLPPLAIEVLEFAFAMAGNDANMWTGFAFPIATWRGFYIKGRTQPRNKGLTVAVGISDATAHDFRRTGSTNITSEQIGMPRFIVSRVLNHISDSGDSAPVTAIYDRNAYLPTSAGRSPLGHRCWKRSSTVATGEEMSSCYPRGADKLASPKAKITERVGRGCARPDYCVVRLVAYRNRLWEAAFNRHPRGDLCRHKGISLLGVSGTECRTRCRR